MKNVMKNKGTALMGIGAAVGPNRAVEAARIATSKSVSKKFMYKTKIPVTPQWVCYRDSSHFMMGPIGNKCQPTENDQCKILKISSRSKSASLNEELSTPFDFASQ